MLPGGAAAVALQRVVEDVVVVRVLASEDAGSARAAQWTSHKLRERGLLCFPWLSQKNARERYTLRLRRSSPQHQSASWSLSVGSKGRNRDIHRLNFSTLLFFPAAKETHFNLFYDY